MTCFKQISSASFVDTLIEIYCKNENEHHKESIEVIEAVALKVNITRTIKYKYCVVYILTWKLELVTFKMLNINLKIKFFAKRILIRVSYTELQKFTVFLYFSGFRLRKYPMLYAKWLWYMMRNTQYSFYLLLRLLRGEEKITCTVTNFQKTKNMQEWCASFLKRNVQQLN